MKRSYHLSSEDLRLILHEHFIKKGEKVSSVDFKTRRMESSFAHHHYAVFDEAIVYLEDPQKENNG
jgi:phage gp16-like protein